MMTSVFNSKEDTSVVAVHKRLNVAIDGPAGAGKSTVSRLLADRLGYTWVDTGAIYRCVAYLAQQTGTDPYLEKQIAELAHGMSIEFKRQAQIQRVYLNEHDVTDKIRTPQISYLSSIVSQHPSVRKILLEIQRKFAAQGGAILEGRDITTVVLPEAEVKIFLDADPQARVHRRAYELELKDEDELKKLQSDMQARDERDSKRQTAPLIVSKDAIRLDTTLLSVEQVVNEIERLIKNKQSISLST